jgi:hypothetical protein
MARSCGLPQAIEIEFLRGRIPAILFDVSLRSLSPPRDFNGKAERFIRTALRE